MKNNDLSNEQHLDEQLKRAQRDLAIVYDASKAMRTFLELNDVLYTILTGVTSHSGLGFNRAVLFLVDTEKRLLEPKLAIGPESAEKAEQIWDYISETNSNLDDLIVKDSIDRNIYSSPLFNRIKDLRISLDNDNSVLSSVYKNSVGIHINREEMNQYTNDPLLKQFPTNELIIMPLKAKDKVNGLIIADNLYTQKEITDDDIRIFQMLANQAGLAIENAHLYELIKHKSHTDSITDLWNHGFFQNTLSEELKKSIDSNKALSLLMIDIDNFKKLNDTYGHQFGDKILKELALILKDSSREIDFVCRYGGEEFAAILTETNKEQGYIIAERIRQNIESYSFTKPSNNELLSITVSIGLATYPDDAQTKEALMMQADKAMYIAKFGGKNQTCAAKIEN